MEESEGKHTGPNLGLLCVRQSDAAPIFLKIMQSFILIQNTYKRCLIGGGEIFVALFSKKKCPFWTISDDTLIF